MTPADIKEVKVIAKLAGNYHKVYRDPDFDSSVFFDNHNELCLELDGEIYALGNPKNLGIDVILNDKKEVGADYYLWIESHKTFLHFKDVQKGDDVMAFLHNGEAAELLWGIVQDDF